MPIATDDIKSSWADEVELEGGALPPPTEVRDNGMKYVTEYKNETDKDGNKKVMKIVRTYKIEKRVVSKSIAYRKTWSKFGECAKDKPGPNPANTIVCEDVYMQFVSSKEEENKQEDESGIDKLKAMGDKTVVKCRNCSGDHWTTKCPWKDTLVPGGKLGLEEKKAAIAGASTSEAGKAPGGASSSKYIPPGMREGAAKRSDNSNMGKRDDTTAIRISNLSDSTTETDLEELVKVFGPIQKLYLAKDKITNQCKGFAYIHFKLKKDAAKAISTLDGHGYDHLILSVDWSKPLSHSNQ